MLQRLSTALWPVKSGNNLNEILQIIYPFYWAKEVTKKYTSIWLIW